MKLRRRLHQDKTRQDFDLVFSCVCVLLRRKSSKMEELLNKWGNGISSSTFSGFIYLATLALLTLTTQAVLGKPENSYLRIHNYSGSLDDEIEKSEFSNVKSLEIRLSNITGFSKDVLKKLQQLESLSIVFSNIQKTEDNVFENCCPKLKTLEIRNWKNFQQMDLKGIGTIPLEKLDVSEEDIPELKEDMFENTNLMELRLINDKIETIDPQAFKNLISLEYLLISGNKLKYFPGEALAPLKNLIALEFFSNGLKTLTTEDIPELPKLIRIMLTNENLKEVNFTDIQKKAPNLNDLYLIGNVGVKIHGIKNDRPVVHNFV